MVCPHIADEGESLKLWNVAENIVNNSRGQPTRGGSQAREVDNTKISLEPWSS
jgi:hypothetical protein